MTRRMTRHAFRPFCSRLEDRRLCDASSAAPVIVPVFETAPPAVVAPLAPLTDDSMLLAANPPTPNPTPMPTPPGLVPTTPIAPGTGTLMAIPAPGPAPAPTPDPGDEPPPPTLVMVNTGGAVVVKAPADMAMDPEDWIYEGTTVDWQTGESWNFWISTGWSGSSPGVGDWGPDSPPETDNAGAVGDWGPNPVFFRVNTTPMFTPGGLPGYTLLPPSALNYTYVGSGVDWVTGQTWDDYVVLDSNH